MNRMPANARRKKKRIKQSKPCPFPVPIKSITGVPVNDNQWMYFTGYLHGHIVAVRHSGDMDLLYKMGFFGKGNLSRGEPEYNNQYRYTTIVSDEVETYPRMVNKKWYKNHLSWVEDVVDASSEEENDEQNSENLKFTDKRTTHTSILIEKVDKSDEVWNPGEGVKDPCLSIEGDDHISDSLEKDKANNFWNEEVNDPWESTSGDANFWNTENVTDKNGKSINESTITGTASNQTEMFNTKAKLKSDEKIEIDSYSCDSNTSMKEQAENYSPPFKKLKVETEPVISKPCVYADSCKTLYDPLCIQNEKKADLFVIPNETYDKNNKRKTRKWRPVMKINPFAIKEYLQLSFVEAFFLCYGLGCLIVKDSTKNLDIKSLWKLFCDKQKNFVPSYICYHYFRSKGWVPKSGLKFGCDYILYKVGPPFYHGSYSVTIQYVQEGSLKPVKGFHQRNLSWRSLCGLNRITEHVGKEVLICYVIKPKNIPIETFSSDYISHFKVKEILLSRWISSQERQNKDTEDIP